MTPEEITIEKAIELHDKHVRLRGTMAGAIDAVYEALNTINWIPIDPDNLPEGDVLCYSNKFKKVFFSKIYIRENVILADSAEFIDSIKVTHYAHVNFPTND